MEVQRNAYIFIAWCAGVAFSAARAQSFDCTKASTPAERTICGADLKRTTICDKLADRYAPLAHGHIGEPPLGVLASTPGSGVQIATTPLARFEQPSTELALWASRQQPPFSLSDDLVKSLQMIESGGGGDLEKAPGVNYYSVSNTQGTAHCSQYVSFSIQKGVAVGALNPVPTDENTPCGIGLYYATVDGTPVFLSESYDYRPGMSVSIDVSTWNSDRFAAACSVQLSYKPHFSDKTLNNWDQSCSGGSCESLRKASFELVEAAERSPSTLLTESIQKLTPAQKAAWDQISQEPTPGLGDAMGDSSGYTAESPLRVPLVQEGQLYVASLGHFTIGWRDFADWGATFETLDGDKLTKRATFAVGMWKGDLESVVID
jgi:hypothetical protein